MYLQLRPLPVCTLVLRAWTPTSELFRLHASTKAASTQSHGKHVESTRASADADRTYHVKDNVATPQ